MFVELFALVVCFALFVVDMPCYFFFLILPSGSLIKLTHEIYRNIINDETWEDFIPFKEHRVLKAVQIVQTQLYIDCRPADTEVQSVAQHWLLWYLHYPWEEAPVNQSGVILIAMADPLLADNDFFPSVHGSGIRPTTWELSTGSQDFFHQ